MNFLAMIIIKIAFLFGKQFHFHFIINFFFWKYFNVLLIASLPSNISNLNQIRKNKRLQINDHHFIEKDVNFYFFMWMKMKVYCLSTFFFSPVSFLLYIYFFPLSFLYFISVVFIISLFITWIHIQWVWIYIYKCCLVCMSAWNNSLPQYLFNVCTFTFNYAYL